MAPLSLSSEFGYAVAVVGASYLANIYGTARNATLYRLTARNATTGAIKVVTARKKYDIKYPTLYSTGTTKNDEMYNCAQRAHQNTLEGLPVVNLMMLSSATVYPRAAALFGFTWVVGRFLYIRGYTEGGPEGRRIGGIVSHLGDFPLLITTFCAAWHLLRA